MNHITKREKEILGFLKKEPMISQDDLAAKMKISRSAIAVHISNLMRKGYILGRGYIFDERSGVLVIGKTWLDVRVGATGSAEKVNIAYDGLGYRLAMELLSYRVKPDLLTFLGRDEIGDQIYSHLLQKGVNVRHIIRDHNCTTGKRVVVQQGTKNLSVVEDMKMEQCLNQKLFAAREELLRTTKVVLIDGTLPDPEIGYLAEKVREHRVLSAIAGCPSLLWHQQRGLLDLPFLFVVCGAQEVGAFSERAVCTEPEALFPVCRKVMEKGLFALIVMLGEQGLILATKDETVHLPKLPLQGAMSDLSTMAGIAGGLASGYSIRLAVRRAMGAKTPRSKD